MSAVILSFLLVVPFAHAETWSSDWGYLQCSRHGSDKYCTGSFGLPYGYNDYSSSIDLTGHRHGGSRIWAEVRLIRNGATQDSWSFYGSGSDLGTEWGGQHYFDCSGCLNTDGSVSAGGSGGDWKLEFWIYVDDAEARLSGRAEARKPDCRCGDGSCDSSCGESGWNCPRYPDGSGGGECSCNLDWESCASNTQIFQSFTNCNGRIGQTCGGSDRCYNDCGGWGSGAHCSPSGVYCRNYNPCEGVTCNNPPSNYCSGNTAVTYRSPGTPVVDGNSCRCDYSTSSNSCPTSGCKDSDTAFTGGCSGGSCYKNSQYCGDDYWTCRDSDTRAYLSNYCSGSGCKSSYSSQEDCNNNNGWVDTSGWYPYCSGTTATQAKDQQYRDYRCSNGRCDDYRVTDTRTITSGGTNCASSSGWYDTSGCYGSCSGTTTTTQKNQEYRSYTCSNGGCTYSVTSTRTTACSTGGDCAAQNGWYNSGSASQVCNGNQQCTGQPQQYRSYTCSGGGCTYSVTNSRTDYSNCQACTFGCSGGRCVPDQNCPTSTCSGDTRQYNGYQSGSQCVYPNSQDCNSNNVCVNSGSPYQTCRDSSTVVTRQDRVYRDYTCSSGSCTVASESSSGSCPAVDSNAQTCTSPSDVCLSGSVLRDYTSSSCSSGSCVPAYNDVTCQFGCSAGRCNTDPCSGVVCSSPPENICENSNTLRVYTSPGTCSVSGSSPSCSYTSSQQTCQYGCLSLPGNDQCSPNPPPVLSSISLTAEYQTYAKSGSNVNVYSSGSDPNGEQVRLRCGSSSGSADLCTGSYAGSGPSCSFSSGFGDSNDHTVYCFLEDSAGARSSVLTATLSSDNTPPTMTLGVSPSSSVTPGTSVTITSTASDSRSGVATINIFVDNQNAKSCSGTTCSYTFTPSYGNHTYYANAQDRLGNVGWTNGVSQFVGSGPPGGCNSNCPPPISVNNPPAVQPISYTGNCRTGQTITLRCTASDTNQASGSLGVKAWAGECTTGNCFATRSWIYYSGAGMTYSSGVFELPLTITSPDGTSIAATCQATDEINAQSNWGDAYPLCSVNKCLAPPSVTVNSIIPNPAGTETVRVTFTVSNAIDGDPSVKVKPGSQAGGTSQISASLVSKVGNTYVYEFDVPASALSGIADIQIGGDYTDENGGGCGFSQVVQMTIDTDKPTTSILCNSGQCTNSIYSPSVSISLGCSDPTTGCDTTRFGVDSPPSDVYDSQRVIYSTGIHAVNYQSNDTLGNLENVKSTQVKVYKPKCKVAAEEPACQPGGFIEEEMRISLKLDKTRVLTNEVLGSRIYCIIRDKETKEIVRPCELDPASLRIAVDKNTAQEKDYFNYYYPGYDYPRYTSTYDSSRIRDYLNERLRNIQESVTLDGWLYKIGKSWALPIYTSVFRSEVCVNGTDELSGLSGENCENYNVTDSDFVLDVSFPDVGVTVPLTTDGLAAPNFTKLMTVNFEAKPTMKTLLASTPCEGVSCRVEFSFVDGQWNYVAEWGGFRRAYVPDPADAASNLFACDQYKTIYIRATAVDGSEAIVSQPVFVNCNTRVTVVPVERRIVLGDVPGGIFNVTVWNPKEEDMTFEVLSATSNPSNYPLQWISFYCNSIGCEAGPVQGDSWLTDDDKARVITPSLTSRSVFVEMATAVRSGSFPVSFVAIDTNDMSYSTQATIQVFAEGLNEFFTWQLAVLVAAAVIIIYALNDFKRKRPAKKRPRRKSKRRQK